MKKVFVLKKMGNIEYLIINKKDIEKVCNIERGKYEVKYSKKDCLTEDEIREYFIKEKGKNLETKDLKKPSLYEYNCKGKEKLFSDLQIVRFDEDLDDEKEIIRQDYFRNAKAVILDMKREKERFERYEIS